MGPWPVLRSSSLMKAVAMRDEIRLDGETRPGQALSDLRPIAPPSPPLNICFKLALLHHQPTREKFLFLLTSSLPENLTANLLVSHFISLLLYVRGHMRAHYANAAARRKQGLILEELLFPCSVTIKPRDITLLAAFYKSHSSLPVTRYFSIAAT